MTIFDLIFIAVFFATVIMLVVVAITVIRGRRRQAFVIARGLVLFDVAYLLVIVVVSLATPARVLHLHEPQCFDDWCLSVEQVESTLSGAESTYTTTLRLFSRARGRAQRENGVSVYLLDEQGRRYEPMDEPHSVSLNVMLSPGESANATRKFTVPADVNNPVLVVAHGRFPGMFIIGDSQSLFHRPSIVRFQ